MSTYQELRFEHVLEFIVRVPEISSFTSYLMLFRGKSLFWTATIKQERVLDRTTQLIQFNGLAQLNSTAFLLFKAPFCNFAFFQMCHRIQIKEVRKHRTLREVFNILTRTQYFYDFRKRQSMCVLVKLENYRSLQFLKRVKVSRIECLKT